MRGGGSSSGARDPAGGIILTLTCWSQHQEPEVTGGSWGSCRVSGNLGSGLAGDELAGPSPGGRGVGTAFLLPLALRPPCRSSSEQTVDLGCAPRPGRGPSSPSPPRWPPQQATLLGGVAWDGPACPWLAAAGARSSLLALCSETSRRGVKAHQVGVFTSQKLAGAARWARRPAPSRLLNAQNGSAHLHFPAEQCARC